MGVRLWSRPNGKVQNGTRKVLLVRRKHTSRSRVKTMIIVFFNSYGIVHKEFIPPGQLNTPSTKMSWNDFENGASESGHCRRLGAAPWLSTSSHCTFNLRISGEEKHSCTSTSSLQPRSSSLRFLPSPQVEIKVEGSSFRDDGKHTKNCNRWPTHTYGKWLPVLL